MAIHGYKGGVISATAPTTSVSGASGIWTTEDQMQAGANWPVAPALSTNSVRLRASASAYMSRTPASAGNRKTWTWSAWVKRGALSSYQRLLTIYNDSTTQFTIGFDNTDKLEIFQYTGSYQINLISTAVYRDPSAWYHIVLAIDTTQATSSNRAKLYVNGSQVTAFGTATYPSQNTELLINTTYTHYIGQKNSTDYFDGYLTEINFIDGQALTPNYFGATDGATGVWQPANYKGTYGTNGFYLPMNVAKDDYLADFLVIAGGGGGGATPNAASNRFGGGGGAGGYRTSVGTSGGGGSAESALTLIPGVTYTITVGAGGAKGNNGSSSTFHTITSSGGGSGGGDSTAGASGGSGGGGTDSRNGGSGTSAQGYAGARGTDSGSPYSTGGGGGAGQTPAQPGASGGGVGGNGVQSSITGTAVFRAGGGGGGDRAGGRGAGGQGGGGQGGSSGGAVAGTANTGGGGGGDGGAFDGSQSGGSGVVILRIPTTSYSGTTTGSPTVTTSGSNTILTYTSSGTYTA